jgi:Ala-tRNA(Pro) deacylase
MDMKVSDFLREQHVPFDVLPHETTFTAQHMAQALDVPGDNVAKTVLLKVDGEYVLAVLQATHAVHFDRAARALGTDNVELAAEEEITRLFPDCEPGAVPPFGSKYGVRTLVDESLTEDEYIVFEGNTHQEAIYMRYYDYQKIEQPRVAAFSMHV